MSSPALKISRGPMLRDIHLPRRPLVAAGTGLVAARHPDFPLLDILAFAKIRKMRRARESRKEERRCRNWSVHWTAGTPTIAVPCHSRRGFALCSAGIPRCPAACGIYQRALAGYLDSPRCWR